MKFLRILAALTALFLSLHTKTLAEIPRARLVMIDLDGCPTCIAWKRDIMPGYLNSEIGRRLPLEQINIKHLESSAFFYLEPPKVYPTFFIVDGEGEPLAKIEGYLSGDFFWGYLESHLAALDL